MDAKTIGLWTIFGLAIAYLIASLGWAGSHMAECNLNYNIAHEQLEDKQAQELANRAQEMGQGLRMPPQPSSKFDFDKAEKTLLAKKNICLAKGGEDAAQEHYQIKMINNAINSVKLEKDDVVSSVGVSMIGYIVVYSILFIAIALGIFGTVKNNKTMMTVFSALFLISALALFSFEMLLLAKSVHQRNAYSSAASEAYESFYFLEKAAAPFTETLEYVEHELETVEQINKIISKVPEALETHKKKVRDDKQQLNDQKNRSTPEERKRIEKDEKKTAKQYENDKNVFNAHTTKTGFTLFSNAFAETAFLTVASVAGFMLFQA